MAEAARIDAILRSDVWPSLVEDESIDFARSLFRERGGLEQELASRLATKFKRYGHEGKYRNGITPMLALSEFKVAFMMTARGKSSRTHDLYWTKVPTIEYGREGYVLVASWVLLEKRKCQR